MVARGGRQVDRRSVGIALLRLLLRVMGRRRRMLMMRMMVMEVVLVVEMLLLLRHIPCREAGERGD